MYRNTDTEAQTQTKTHTLASVRLHNCMPVYCRCGFMDIYCSIGF